MDFENNVLLIVEEESDFEKLKQMLSDTNQKLVQDPNSMQLILLQCLLLIALGQEKDALKIFLNCNYCERLQEIYEIESSWDQMIESNQLQEVFDALNDALIKYPFHTGILIKLQQVVEKMQNKDLINVCMTKIKAAYFAYNLLFIALADYLQSEKKYDDAISALEFLLRKFPESIKAYHLRGICYFKMNKYEEAYQDFLKAIEYKPDDIEFNFNLAICQMKMEKFEDAIQNLKKIIDLDQNYFDAYIKMADALEQIKKTDEAVKVLNDLLKMNPSLDIAYYSLASILIENERYLEAGQVLVKATLLKPSNPSFCQLLSRLYKKQGMEQLGDQYLEMGVDNLMENFFFGLLH
ncbi:hypothetical protein ABPG74_010220 [Tetrahymena malaccensis]